MGEPAQNQRRPGTPPLGSIVRPRKMMALESVVDSPLPVPVSACGSRSVRRVEFDALSKLDGSASSTAPISQGKSSDTKVKQRQRDIQWENHVHIQDFQGNPVEDFNFDTSSDESTTGNVRLLLYDNHPDTVHAHPDFWNVTPEPQMLAVLPQDYTLFSALADELDNSLQAVFQLQAGKQRLICVNLDHKEAKISIYDTGKGMDSTPKNCISKWGTIGSSMNRHSVSEAIGGRPPYLKPNFGMYGFGGIGAGLHLGGCITVSSKTETSKRVAILHLGRESLTNNVKAGSAWNTGGEFRLPTEQELKWSPHGSFTKVEISDLNRKVITWKVEEVQRKLLDFYFPYIQNDEGTGGITSRPVEIRVNGEDLAGVLGGEVAYSNYYSGVGDPYVLILEFTKLKDITESEHGGDRVDKANARITYRYFPIKKGKEAIDDILEKLKNEDPEFVGVNFENFSRRTIRRLGRLLPDAQGGRLPFMEPKKVFKTNEVNRHCYKRVKALKDVDAGFVPTTSKFSEWCMGLSAETLTGKEEPPIHLKLQKGLPGLINNDMVLHATVECFISEGLADHPGETRIICRPMGIPEERGSKETVGDQNQEPCFILGESRAFPIEILFTDKVEKVEEAVWQKQLEKIRSKSPAFVELLNEQEVFKLAGEYESLLKYANLEAGKALPTEIIAVVRPKICKSSTSGKLAESTLEAPRLEQKFIFSESMEMTLVVRQMKYYPPEVKILKKDMVEAEKVYEMKSTARTRNTLKGLYCFSTFGASFESITRTTGTYTFFFTLASVKYQEVEDFIFRMNITPSSKIGHWNLCSHPGNCCEHHQNQSPEVMRVRLGGVVPRNLYLTRVDEFSNPMRFRRIPTDIKCGILIVGGDQVMISTTISKDMLVISDGDHLNLEILVIRELRKFGCMDGLTQKIEVGGGNLEPFKPTMQAVLRMTVGNVTVANFAISVLPGETASARIKKSEAPDNWLLPGEIIEHIVFEVLDKYENPISSGENVKVALEGFALQDKNGHTRSVDGNGCLDLGLRLRVTAGYGGTASVELLSTEDLHLCETKFDIISRNLQTKNEPDHVGAGSQLVGVVIEAVDENGVVDNKMDGTAHYLKLDWNPNISVPLHHGRCTLPPIQIPNTPGIWKGCVSHTQYPELQTSFSVWVEESKREGDDSMAAEDPRDTPGSPVVPPHRSESRVPHTQVVHNCPVILPQYSESRDAVSRNQVVREASHANRYNTPVQVAPPEQKKKLEMKLGRLRLKVNKHGNELAKLERTKKDYEDSRKRYKRELDMLAKEVKFETTAMESKHVEPHNPTSSETEPSTTVQVEMQIARLGTPPGSHAATILLQAQREQHSEIVTEDIIGIVAFLGAVESEEINRALVEFLGLENMVAIICGSESAAECIGAPSSDGTLDKRKLKGLFDFAKSRNLQISGRFRVIALTDQSSFYKRLDGQAAVDHTHPQKLLRMGQIDSKPGSDRSVGSLGYAVNIIHLNEDQLRIRVSAHGLRESLFFVLFGFLEVFDTTNNMLRAYRVGKGLRSTAVSLDGGLIRKSNQFELGSRELNSAVWFPAVKAPSDSTTQKNLAANPLKRKFKPLNILKPV